MLSTVCARRSKGFYTLTVSSPFLLQQIKISGFIMENSSGIIDDLSQDSSRCEKVGKNQDFVVAIFNSRRFKVCGVLSL